MTSKLTRERLQEIAEDGFLKHGESKELARMALAAMDSEPVAWTWHYREKWHVTNDEERARDLAWDGVKVEPLYRHAQPAPEKYNIGDATMRHIFTPTGMTNVSDMQAVFDRVEAVLVGMEQPVPVVPVVPVTDAMAYAFHHALTDSPLGDDDVEDIKAGLRAALVNGFNSQPAPVVPEKCPAEIRDLIASHSDALFNDDDAQEIWNACRAAMLQELQKSAGVSNNCRSNEKLQDQHVESLTTIKAAPALDSLPKNAKSLTGNSPVIPDGYVMVPMRLTAENGAKGALSGEFSETKFVNCPECFGDDECETCDGSGRIEIKVPVSWTTIKEIWIKGVEHFAAAPQENN